jgi:hypothetical protein
MHYRIITDIMVFQVSDQVLAYERKIEKDVQGRFNWLCIFMYILQFIQFPIW